MPDKSERPPDSDFQQQNLRAWQPLLTPGWVIGTLFFIGCLFLPIGVVILQASEGIVHLEKQYDQLPGPLSTVDIEIPADMEPPVYFYYKLTNFYQNHRRYVNSRNDDQLAGDDVTDLSSCDPLEMNGNKTMYPCGLIANSYFSDKFLTPAVTRPSDGSGPFMMDWTDKGIAWESDVQKKFKQGHFDPETMTRSTLSGVEMNHTSEDFIVWMRIAGLPEFMKLRYIVKTRLLKGDKVSFTIDNNYNVSGFSGTKSIVLSTTSWLGGRNFFLGYAYIAVAGACLLLAILFLIKHKVSARPLGDMAYFNWVKPANPTIT
jgi:hypothetical protein